VSGDAGAAAADAGAGAAGTGAGAAAPSGRIRLARREDVPRLLAIYAPFVLRTPVTFETEVPGEEAFWERVRGVLAHAPWLVHEAPDGDIAGYAYAARHRERAAYGWCVEPSVYVADRHRRRGVARALYGRLLDLLRRQGFRHAYAGITLPNEASVALHEALGFRLLATYRSVGYKLGAWRDVGWWELGLGQGSAPEAPRTPAEVAAG